MEKVELRNMTDFSYTMRESLRALKTNIQFCGDDIQTMLVTSSVPDEGKSTVTFDLARSLTDSGKTVLLIDSDMRKSVLMGRLRAKNQDNEEIKGLSHYLSGQVTLADVLCSTQIPKLFMIFAGPSIPNPTEMLDKKYFKALMEFVKEQFDYILIDCAPLGAAIDAAVIAKYCDGAILVVAQGVASTRMVQDAKKQLEMSGVRILGAILNKVKMDKGHYGKYYGRYYGNYYGSYYGEEGKKK